MSSNVTWRPAEKSDRQLLQAFTCTDPKGPAFEREVQTWIRRDSIKDTNRGLKQDHRLLLLFDEDELVGVGSHVRWRNSQGEQGRLLFVAAVSTDAQGKVLSNGTKASTSLMNVLLNDIIERDEPSPPWVAAKIHRENVRSLALCDRFGLVAEQSLSESYVLRAGPFPEVT